jgi:hypothetical protein
MAAHAAQEAAQAWAATTASRLLASTGQPLTPAQLRAFAMLAFEAGAAWAREQE